MRSKQTATLCPFRSVACGQDVGTCAGASGLPGASVVSPTVPSDQILLLSMDAKTDCCVRTV